MIFFSFLFRIKPLRCSLQLGGNLLRATLKQLNSSVTVLMGEDWHVPSFIIHHTTAVS